jgi:hypothetical protein
MSGSAGFPGNPRVGETACADMFGGAAPGETWALDGQRLPGWFASRGDRLDRPERGWEVVLDLTILAPARVDGAAVRWRTA